jgi:hypothetical protein
MAQAPEPASRDARRLARLPVHPRMIDRRDDPRVLRRQGPVMHLDIAAFRPAAGPGLEPSNALLDTSGPDRHARHRGALASARVRRLLAVEVATPSCRSAAAGL